MEESTQKNISQPDISSAPDALQVCAKERDEYLNGWKRAKADLANYKKEEAQRFQDFTKFASESVIHDLLQVLDSFELGLQSISAADGSRKSIEVIRAQFLEVLKRHGLAPISAEIGAVFDPAQHEAIGEITSQAPPGTIAGVAATGYSLNGRVVRPVRVQISKSS